MTDSSIPPDPDDEDFSPTPAHWTSEEAAEAGAPDSPAEEASGEGPSPDLDPGTADEVAPGDGPPA
jgi:hypothetical protein